MVVLRIDEQLQEWIVNMSCENLAKCFKPVLLYTVVFGCMMCLILNYLGYITVETKLVTSLIVLAFNAAIDEGGSNEN